MIANDSICGINSIVVVSKNSSKLKSNYSDCLLSTANINTIIAKRAKGETLLRQYTRINSPSKEQAHTCTNMFILTILVKSFAVFASIKCQNENNSFHSHLDWISIIIKFILIIFIVRSTFAEELELSSNKRSRISEMNGDYSDEHFNSE